MKFMPDTAAAANTIAIRRTATSRLGSFDHRAVPFGSEFSDHMLTMEFRDGNWQPPSIVPYGPIAFEPGIMLLHYAQMVFEGLKAYRGIDDRIRLFRPDRNGLRMQASCRRLCVPEMPVALFVDTVKAIVSADREWVPRGPGEALYVRPLLLSNEPHLAVRPSNRYLYVIMTCPVGAYFRAGSGGLSLRVERDHIRAAPGGLGEAKTAANYAGSLAAGEKARAAGFDQVIWLDGIERRYIEEAGIMNIFVKIAGEVLTPPLGGTILPGVTRASVLHLLRDRGVRVAERPIDLGEVLDAHRSGTLEEMFATGTAAVVTPIAQIAADGETIDLRNRPTALATDLFNALTDIQYGRTNDRFGWTVAVE